jgi:hypothetical protein
LFDVNTYAVTIGEVRFIVVVGSDRLLLLLLFEVGAAAVDKFREMLW